MPLKVVHFYQQGSRGWTETYYATGSNPQSFATSYATPANMQNWMAFRANDVVLTEVRVSLIGSPRVTYSTPFNLFSINAFDDVQNFNQDTYGEDALVLLRGATGIPRHLWLRGLPNIFISYGASGFPTPPAQFLSLINALGNAIVTSGLQIQNANIPTPSSGNWFNVAFVEAFSSGTAVSSILQCPIIPTFPNPLGPIYFQGVPRNLLPGFPRILTPISYVTGVPPANNQVYVPYLYRGNQANTYPPKMKFCLLSYTYAAITSVAFETYGVRKTGRPTGLPRGRAPVVIKRQ